MFLFVVHTLSLPVVPIRLVVEGGCVDDCIMAEHPINFPVMFSSGDVREWFLRFEICSKANKWSKKTMSLKLPTLLEGEALVARVELSENVQENYDAMKQHLLTRLKTVEFVSLDRFHRRVLEPEELPTMYLYQLRKLLDQAMPNMDDTVRETLLLHQFFVGLPIPISWQLRAVRET